MQPNIYNLYFNISGDSNETQDFDYIYPSIDSLSATDFPMNLTNLMNLVCLFEARKNYGIFTQIAHITLTPYLHLIFDIL